MFWFLFGVLLFLLIRNNFDVQGVKKDARRSARGIRKGVQEGKQQAEAKENRELLKEMEQEGKQQAEAKENMELLKEMEQKAGTAAMLANVPTIDFPADDPKYDSSRKYMYA